MFRLSIIFIFLFFFCNGQEKSFQEIDSALYRSYDDAHNTLSFEKAIGINQKLVEKCKKLDYKKGVGEAYLNIANFSCYLTRYKESLKYLELAEKNITQTQDYYLRVLLYIEYGKVYAFLNLYEVSLNYYNKAVVANQKIKNPSKKLHSLHYVYACKADNFSQLGRYDSMYVYFKKAYKLDPDPITASNVADYFILHKKSQIDSANYYLKIATRTYEKNFYEPYQKLAVLEIYGKYFFEKKDYHKALEKYNLALDLANHIQKDDERKNVYQALYRTYQALKDDKKTAEFQQKYSDLNDSLNLSDKKALNLSVEKLVKDKESQNEEEKTQLKNRNYYIIGIITLIAIGLMIAGYYLYTKKKKEKELLIRSQKDEISQKEIEKRSLETKVNDAFEEVLKLARENNPAFLARFKEVYPEFCAKILALHPDLLTSELIFCAFLKLNFSTKEIANYTYVTEKAVQARKSRIRKKFNIPSDEDLYIWFNKIYS